MKRVAWSGRSAVKVPRSLAVVVRTLDDKKAEDLKVLDVRAQSSLTDYLVLATGTSGPHLRALRTELEKTLDNANVSIVGVESAEGSGWTVFDAFEVMVHVFTAETRAKYRLEMLWKDAIDIPIDQVLAKRMSDGRSRKSRASKGKAIDETRE
jgi:ribosome-associated protein